MNGMDGGGNGMEERTRGGRATYCEGVQPRLHEPFSVNKLGIVNAVHSDTANHGR